MIKHLSTAALIICSFLVNAQSLLLIDRDHGNRVVNDSVLTLSSADPEIVDLTMYFTMKNNTDHLLSLNLRKTVHMMADSTIDYFCFGIKCWPETDTTNYPDTLLPGAEDYTFASHVVHYRRFEMPPLPPGKSSITYTVYDDTSFPEPVEASVTVNYHHQDGVGLEKRDLKEIVVYPNPASTFITLQGIPLNQPAEYAIYSMVGTRIASGKWLPGTQTTIDIRNLTNGMYIIKLTTGKSVLSGKFIRE